MDGFHCGFSADDRQSSAELRIRREVAGSDGLVPCYEHWNLVKEAQCDAAGTDSVGFVDPQLAVLVVRSGIFRFGSTCARQTVHIRILLGPTCSWRVLQQYLYVPGGSSILAEIDICGQQYNAL